MRLHLFNRSSFALLLYVLTQLFAVALSASGAPPAKGSLPPDMVAYFAGNWTGSGAFAKSGKPLSSDYGFVPDIENKCLVVHQKEKPPNDFEFVALWSVNSTTGELVMLIVSNHEHGASVLHGYGWKDGKLSFETWSEDPKVLARERFIFYRDSAATFHTMYEWSLDGGKTWAVGDRQSFTKSS